MTAPDRLRQRVERLKATKVVEDHETGCWLWMGARQREGYGTVNVSLPGKKTSTTAHRLFYEALVGPIPTGHTVHHRCANPPCVNPAHLETATQRANMGEMFARRALEASVAAAEAALEGVEDSLLDAARQSADLPEETEP